MIRRISDSGTWYRMEYLAISPSMARGLETAGRISASAKGVACRGRALRMAGVAVLAQPLSSAATNAAMMIRSPRRNRLLLQSLAPGLLASVLRHGKSADLTVWPPSWVLIHE